MNSIKLIIACTATVLLTACGGGSDPTATPVDPPKTVYYTPAAPKTGDTYAYSINRVATGSPLTNLVVMPSSYEVGNVSADGSYYLNGYDVDGNLDTNTLHDGQGKVVRQNSCTFTPALTELPTPYFVGQTFSQTSTGTCSASAPGYFSAPTEVNVNSSVLTYEVITVAAGTFNALKIKTDKATSYNNGIKSTESKTCWLDVISGASVKCNSTVNYDYTQTNVVALQTLIALLRPSTSATFVDTITTELTSIKHAADFPFSLTASIDGVSIPSVYQTPSEQQPLMLIGGSTLTLNVTQPLNWTISSAITNTPITLPTGDQVIVIDGVSVSISIVGGKISAKVLNAPVSGIFVFVVKGSSLIDPTQSTSITVYNSITQSANFQTAPNCLGSLKFC